MNATVVHNKQILPFDKSVRMPLAVEFEWMPATYVMKTILSSDNWPILLYIIETMEIMSQALMSFTQLLGAYSPICSLRQHLALNYMLTELL